MLPGGVANPDSLRQDEDAVAFVTSRGPDDLPAFCSKLVEEICEGRHERMARSA